MQIVIIMVIGVLLGRQFPSRHKKKNDCFQIICTTLLIFAMGVTLGRRENFIQELSTLGLQSLLFSLIPASCSLLLVFILSRRFLENNCKEDK